ncbi:hypothetical protein [Mycobacterium sp. IS-1496]|uniref:hypothetical protein n=1 Tax=Mycobacterium sp. IS-1496 TaxID=1772284 RepID=UPI0009E7C7AC|nr:hypothetical protein [Mycobacterium sp. IS-1496]
MKPQARPDRPEPAAARRILENAVNRVDLVRADLNTVLRELSPDVPLFAVVDLVTALGHLRQAAVLVDGVADALEAVEVRR